MKKFICMHQTMDQSDKSIYPEKWLIVFDHAWENTEELGNGISRRDSESY
jgi:hypothetical protein